MYIRLEAQTSNVCRTEGLAGPLVSHAIPQTFGTFPAFTGMSRLFSIRIRSLPPAALCVSYCMQDILKPPLTNRRPQYGLMHSTTAKSYYPTPAPRQGQWGPAQDPTGWVAAFSPSPPAIQSQVYRVFLCMSKQSLPCDRTFTCILLVYSLPLHASTFDASLCTSRALLPPRRIRTGRHGIYCQPFSLWAIASA